MRMVDERDGEKTKDEFLVELRHRIASLERTVAGVKQAEIVARVACEYAENIVETVRHPLLVLDSDLKVRSANQSFYDTFKVTPKETIGNLIYDLGNSQWDIPRLRELLQDILPKDKEFDNFEINHVFSDIGHKIMLLNARRVVQEGAASELILLAIEDITERRQLESLLEESEERYRRLFETAADGILLLEKNEGNVTHVNPAATEMLGYSKEECIGKKLHEIGVSPEIGGFQTIMQTLDKSGIVYYDDVPVKTKTGQFIDTDIYMVDRARLVQCNIRDVSERKLMGVELRKTSAELMISNKDLKQFAFVAAHDLQEPLRTVASFVKLLEKRYRGKLDEKAEEYINYIVDGTKRMHVLIDDLLAYSQIDTTGKNFGPLDINKLIQRTLIDLRLSIEENEAKVTYDPMPTVHADSSQLISLFWNLIGNAIKFRGEEAPRIHISAARKGDEWVFAVRDNGIGMDPQYIEGIFLMFQRLHTKGEYPGTGIGLAICKRIVENHGGRIWVESGLGKGSTFFFTVPERKQHN
jgi:PAS domain S-box-containing protein